MLIPDVDSHGRIVWIDLQASHPRHKLLSAAIAGTFVLETRQNGERFEALITGVDGRVIDQALRDDVAAARRWLDASAAAIMRERARLDIARRLIADAGDELVVIKADFAAAQLPSFFPEAHRR